MAYSQNNDIASIGNTLCIARTKTDRLSDWYDKMTKIPTLWNAVPIINQYKSLILGMQALPYVGNLAGKSRRGCSIYITRIKSCSIDSTGVCTGSPRIR